jgi:hypothetical protein
MRQRCLSLPQAAALRLLKGGRSAFLKPEAALKGDLTLRKPQAALPQAAALRVLEPQAAPSYGA